MNIPFKASALQVKIFCLYRFAGAKPPTERPRRRSKTLPKRGNNIVTGDFHEPHRTRPNSHGAKRDEKATAHNRPRQMLQNSPVPCRDLFSAPCDLQPLNSPLSGRRPRSEKAALRTNTSSVRRKPFRRTPSVPLTASVFDGTAPTLPASAGSTRKNIRHARSITVNVSPTAFPHGSLTGGGAGERRA
jgi:hypothetical protein